jgi:hypothetical protein
MRAFVLRDPSILATHRSRGSWESPNHDAVALCLSSFEAILKLRRGRPGYRPLRIPRSRQALKFGMVLQSIQNCVVEMGGYSFVTNSLTSVR